MNKEPRDQVLDLLLCVARKELDSRSEDRLNTVLRQPTPWDSVLQQATRHGLAPLLHRHLDGLTPGTVPSETLVSLRLLSRDIARRNIFLAGSVCWIMEMLDAAEVPAIALKGPALGAAVYGDPGLRTSFDIDILVQEADVGRAGRLFLERGFQTENGRLTPRQRAVCFQKQCEQHFNRESDRIRVELHWRIVPAAYALKLDLSAVWGTGHHTLLGDRRIPILPPEELFLTLCVHGLKHIWDRMLLICDLAELSRTFGHLDWTRVLALADRSRCRRTLLLGVYLAGRWLGAPVPGNLLSMAESDRKVCRWADRVWAGYHRDRPLPVIAFQAFQLATRERWRDRAAMAKSLLLTPTAADWELMPLPDALFPLYSVTRPFRVAARYLRRPLRRVNG